MRVPAGRHPASQKPGTAVQQRVNRGNTCVYVLVESVTPFGENLEEAKFNQHVNGRVYRYTRATRLRTLFRRRWLSSRVGRTFTRHQPRVYGRRVTTAVRCVRYRASKGACGVG